jgi:hypothetical protein
VHEPMSWLGVSAPVISRTRLGTSSASVATTSSALQHSSVFVVSCQPGMSRGYPKSVACSQHGWVQWCSTLQRRGQVSTEEESHPRASSSATCSLRRTTLIVFTPRTCRGKLAVIMTRS